MKKQQHQQQQSYKAQQQIQKIKRKETRAMSLKYNTAEK